VVPVHDIETDGTTAHGAAAVALLALRASLRRQEDGALPDLFRLDPDRSLQTLASAASEVAALPKPVRYRGEVSGGAITVKIESPDGVQGPRDLNAGPVAMNTPRLLSFVRQRYGSAADQLRVACLGAGLLLRVNVLAVAEWERDYELRELYSAGADFADSSYPSGQGVRPEDIPDCVALISFGAGLRPVEVGPDGLPLELPDGLPLELMYELLDELLEDVAGPREVE
jgi:hypothetical protein